MTADVDRPKQRAPVKAAKARRPRVKTGRSAGAVSDRYRQFVEAYLSNGQNASEAAVSCGYSKHSAGKLGWTILHDPAVQQMIQSRAQVVAEAAEMSTENWARELRALAFSRIGDLVGADGKPLPIKDLPSHVQAAISSVEVSATGETKYKFWDKPAALQVIAKHLGLFEKDNAQQRPDVRVNIVLVG